MITYQHETLTEEVFTELDAIHKTYYKEMVPEHQLPYEPAYKQYLGAQDTGNLVLVTCRDDGKMVGCALFFVVPYLYSWRHRLAMEDWFYVDAQYRKGFVGIKLLKTAEKVLKSYGVSIINVLCKAHQDKTPLYERLGYKYTEKHFFKMV